MPKIDTMSSFKRYLLFSSGFTALVILMIACVVQRNPVTGKKRAYGYSWAEEQQIGKDADRSIQQQYGIYDDQELGDYVSRIGHEVLQESHLRREDTPEKYKNTEFTFRVLNSPVVNAFALPGGYVYVTRGLLAHLNNEAQLAVVLGHEIGHVAARHASQQAFQQKIGQAALVGGAVVGQEVFGVSGQDILNLGGSAAKLLFLKYSRDDEREADQLGVEYAAMAGYKASEAAAFFTSLKRISAKSGQSLPTLLSTHPDPGAREQTIPKLAEQWKEKGYDQTVVDQTKYLHEVDHIVYGDNPREGYVENDTFYHPDLKFKFPVPSGWQVINQPSQVAIVNQDQNAVIIMQVDSKANSPEGSVSDFISNDQITVESQGAASSGNLPAYEAVAHAQTQDGQLLKLYVYGLKYNNMIYQFIAYSSESSFAGYKPQFIRTTNGFSPLTDKNILAVKPVRITLLSTNKTADFSSFLPSKFPMDITGQDVSIMNQYEMNSQVSQGTLLKIPEQN